MKTKENVIEKSKMIRKIKKKKLIVKIVIIAMTIAIFFIALIIIDKNKKILGENFSNFFQIGTNSKQEEAIKVAEEKFKELGESIDKENLEIFKIQRNGEVYYYISAKENTIEVREKDNKITRINSVPVE